MTEVQPITSAMPIAGTVPIASTMPITSAMRPVPDGVSELRICPTARGGQKARIPDAGGSRRSAPHCRALPRSDRRCRPGGASSRHPVRRRIARGPRHREGPQRISNRSHHRSRAPRKHCTGPRAQKRTARRTYRNPRARRSGGSVRGHSALTQRAFLQARGYRGARRERSRRTRRETTRAGRQVTRSTRT